ncbi:hypothetical protein [Phenylobacterium sp.]|uniref:hypothetical protein n=1 Tax=Phenylobacterium sp. TaxID=1871053 RepID=UPI002DE21F7B|nr:hypothetical protein [Phenylobacterium sp.]
MTEGPAAEPEAIAELIRLAAAGSFGSRVIVALVRRIVELQDHASEDELLSLIAQVDALLRDEGPTPH